MSTKNQQLTKDWCHTGVMADKNLNFNHIGFKLILKIKYAFNNNVQKMISHLHIITKYKWTSSLLVYFYILKKFHIYMNHLQ